MQPLFRKIAAALPGMETLSSTKQEDMVDVNLKPTTNTNSAEQQGGGCACQSLYFTWKKRKKKKKTKKEVGNTKKLGGVHQLDNLLLLLLKMCFATGLNGLLGSCQSAIGCQIGDILNVVVTMKHIHNFCLLSA